jgi:hypothetical protein
MMSAVGPKRTLWPCAWMSALRDEADMLSGAGPVLPIVASKSRITLRPKFKSNWGGEAYGKHGGAVLIHSIPMCELFTLELFVCHLHIRIGTAKSCG